MMNEAASGSRELKIILQTTYYTNTMRKKLLAMLMAAGNAIACSLAAQRADARTILKSICRLKGQEENTLQGLGIVVA